MVIFTFSGPAGAAVGASSASGVAFGVHAASSAAPLAAPAKDKNSLLLICLAFIARTPPI